MEFVEVKFATNRTVYIDGVDGGETNKILRVGTGTHAFDLGEPKNYQPEEIVVAVKDTDSLIPMTIEFKEV